MSSDLGTVLTSVVVASIVAATIAGFYELRAKERDYENDYYKLILQRRVVAYEQLEALIISLKTAVLDVDRKPYHLAFANDEDWQNVYTLLANVLSQSLWLSHEAFKKTQEFNYLIFRFKPEKTSVIDFGKANYEKLAALRTDLERVLAVDMMRLHDIKSFLRSRKEIENDFVAVQVDG